MARAPRGAPGPTTPVYVISVAAELTGLHPQTLRQYDRAGLVSPGRTGGGGRRYSLHDIELLREVAQLTAAGIGLEGVRRILELENQVAALQQRNRELRARVHDLQAALDRAMNVLAERRPRLPALRSQTGRVSPFD
ncbi:MAG TPA: MerR family transcriptional regulator [Marmoricola sp.]|nr:MerR family transcriptional regulator [Marmoricola sp.]